MYVPTHFNESRIEVLHELIRMHPFGVLVTNGTNGMEANHIPFELEADGRSPGTLHAHVARANPVWQTLAKGDEALVIFSAPASYISPTWYPSKKDFHKQVPTWNYMVAHAYGKVTVRDDERYVRGVVGKLTRTHEAGQPTPWKMTDSPKEFIDMALKAIVGIEIEITRLLGKFKLSQNKEARDIRNAGEMLKSKSKLELGEAMLRCTEQKRD